MGRVTPIIRRPGGKSRMLKHLLPVIDGTPHKVYVEPCCGGAAVLLAKRPSYHEVLNDTDGEIVNLYKQVKYHLPAVIRETRLSVDSRQWFAESKGHPHRTEIQRAADYLYRNLYSFGADAHSYGVGSAGTARPGCCAASPRSTGGSTASPSRASTGSAVSACTTAPRPCTSSTRPTPPTTASPPTRAGRAATWNGCAVCWRN